jgi:hypothetical protein
MTDETNFNRIDSNPPAQKSKIANKIFTTFCKKEQLQDMIDQIKSTYTIANNKILVFTSPQTEEYILTYNVEPGNLLEVKVIGNTVLLHRNKDSKTLFSINAINLLNQMENGTTEGYYEVPWEKYQKSILLTRNKVFTQLKTELYTIIDTTPNTENNFNI